MSQVMQFAGAFWAGVAVGVAFMVFAWPKVQARFERVKRQVEAARAAE